MAAITNTYTRFDAKGVREDLSNVIYQISPEETPFMSNVGRENVTNTFFEWQTDDLAAASTTNAQIVALIFDCFFIFSLVRDILITKFDKNYYINAYSLKKEYTFNLGARLLYRNSSLESRSASDQLL